MEINDLGLKIIKDSENLFLESYLCPANVWTIGYGHTRNIKPGMTCTKEQAEQWLKEDLSFFEQVVNKSVKVELNVNQFSALVSLVFNIGGSAFTSSTLLKLLNSGDYQSASGQFKEWVKGSRGETLPGLVIRRKREKELFMTSTNGKYPELQLIITNKSEVNINQAKPELLKEIQSALGIDVDGIVGGETLAALADFKARESLQYPELVGISTATELVKEIEEVEEQEDIESTPTEINKDVGSKTGNSMKLPTGEIVYANQFMVDGVPLTWGETTANCTRVPTTKEYVENGLKLARLFGELREDFGSPIAVTSGYRPPTVNRAVGGASNSQHLYFRALDIKPFNGDFKGLWQCIERSKFTGLGDAVFRGRNKGFFHVDTRSGGRVVFSY